MRWITLEDCQQIYVSQINAGTLLRPEVLDAAIHAPLHSFGGVEAYPTLIEKVARLTFGIAQAQAYLVMGTSDWHGTAPSWCYRATA